MYKLVSTVKDAIHLLENGESVRISSGCIGHNRHCSEQEGFKRELENIYNDRLLVEIEEGVCRYSYKFKLK